MGSNHIEKQTFWGEHWNLDLLQQQRFHAIYVVAKEYRNLPVALPTKSYQPLLGARDAQTVRVAWAARARLRRGGAVCHVCISAYACEAPAHPLRASGPCTASTPLSCHGQGREDLTSGYHFASILPSQYMTYRFRQERWGLLWYSPKRHESNLKLCPFVCRDNLTLTFLYAHENGLQWKG